MIREKGRRVMKNIFYTLGLCLVSLLVSCGEEEIDISLPSEKNPIVNERFEDPNLLEAVLPVADANNDGILTEAEAASTKRLILKDKWDQYKSFTSLKGLEMFTGLELLYIGRTDTVDASPFHTLRSLVCDQNVHHLTLPEPCLLDSLACNLKVANGFDLYGMKNLIYLKTWCDDFSLRIPNHPTLQAYSVERNGYNLDTLDLSGCRKLHRLTIEKDMPHQDVYYIKFMNLKDCVSLERLTHTGSVKTDLTNCSSLKSIEDGKGTLLLDGCTALTKYQGDYYDSYDFSPCKSLTDMDLYVSGESNIPVKPIPSLKRLKLRGYVDYTRVNDFPSLEYLDLSSMDPSNAHEHFVEVTGCATLDTLITYSSTLTSLDFSGCTDLKYLFFLDNIEKLDVSDCQNLELYCQETPELTFNKSIRKLYCGRLGHTARSFDFSGCDRLEELTLFYFSSTDTVGIPYLNLDGCVSLRRLKVNDVKQGSLSLAGCAQLDSVIINRSNLRNIDFTGCTALRTVWIDQTPIEDFPMEGLSALERLEIHYSDLHFFEMAGVYPALRRIDLDNNLTLSVGVVDVTQCPALEYISIDRRNTYDGVLRLTREQDVHLKVQGFGDLEIVY